MDRIFHARIPFYLYLFAALAGGMALFFFWNSHPVPGGIMLWCVVMATERAIHTTYTFTADDLLVIVYGRFRSERRIPLQKVERVEKLRCFRIGRFCLLEYLLLFYDGERHVTLMPEREAEFLETLQQRRRK